VNSGMLGTPASAKLEFAQDQKYARVDYDVAEGVAAGAISTAVWTTHLFNRIANDDDNLIERVASGIVYIKPGRYFTRLTTVIIQLDLCCVRINDVQTDGILSLIPMYSASNKLFSALEQIEDVIDVRHARGIRCQMHASTGSANTYTTGLSSSSPAVSGDRDCHGLWEFWELRDA
jgi:hypothetical protein